MHIIIWPPPSFAYLPLTSSHHVVYHLICIKIFTCFETHQAILGLSFFVHTHFYFLA